MKKLILIMLLFASPLMAQYSLKITLPTTGLSSVIKFAKYPHNDLGADEVTGITVTEPGSAKTYLAVGFTTYQYVTLWINGVKQTWFDSVQVGNPATVFGRLGSANTWLLSNAFYYPYINSSSPLYSDYNHAQFFGSTLIWKDYANAKYGQLSASNTWSGSTNQFEGALFGDDVTFEGSTSGINYEYDVNSDLYLRVTQPSNNTVVWKRWITDHYLDTSYIYWDGSKLRLGLGKGPLYGRVNTESPINVNTNHFEYSGDQLSLKYALNFDSLFIKKDTIISENIYTKGWGIKRRFWSQRDSMDLYWHYTNTLTNTRDSFAVINKVYETDNSSTITLTAADQRLDSLYLGPGTYSIDFGANYTFISASLGGDAATSDSIVLGLNKGTGVGNILKNNIIATRHYMEGANGPVLGVLSWKAMIKLTSDTWVYIVGKRNNTLNDYGHIIYRQYILATRIN